MPPVHEDATDDADAQALEKEMPGVVEKADRYAGEVTLTVPAGRARVQETGRRLAAACETRSARG